MLLQGGVVGKTNAAQDFVPEGLVGSDGNARARESDGKLPPCAEMFGGLESLQKGRLTLLPVGW